MKRIVASVGLVAVGATGLHAASYAPGLTRMEAEKPWSISASLRGFYDDNYLTAPKDTEESSFGFELSPSVGINLPMDQTLLSARYTYTMKYYDDRSENEIDHQHEFDARMDHKFSERYNLMISDSFVYTQEPEILDDTVGSPLRTDSDVFRNRAKIRFRAEITESFGLEPFYENSWYNYTDEGAGSRSALLDRFEHLIGLNGRYRVRRDLISLVGYQYGIVDYIGDDKLLPPGTPPPAGLAESDTRNSTSHYFYVGADHNVSRQLSASIRVGAQYTEYDELDDDTWGPYADISGTYEYLPGSYVQAGFRHTRNATDVVTVDPTSNELDLTLDQETTTIYGSVTHKITPRMFGSVLGQFQHGTFQGGSADGDSDNLFLVGLNLEYKINQHWSAETGYNYDRLDSDQPFRSFTRNRVYIGVRATY